MPDMNCRVKRVGLRVALLWGILGLIMLLPATVWAGGHTVKVPPPNGVDDTAKIQGALDECVAHGLGCTVQLAAGNYRTSQLVEYNFRGTFKGMGMDRTTIEALHNLPVNIPDPVVYGECLPNTTTCLWPSLIIFVDETSTSPISPFTSPLPRVRPPQVGPSSDWKLAASSTDCASWANIRQMSLSIASALKACPTIPQTASASWWVLVSASTSSMKSSTPANFHAAPRLLIIIS